MPNFPTQPYKGTRDFYPNAQQFVNNQKDTNFFLYQKYILDTWRKTLLECGFVEYDCSIIEQAEIYLAKSGEELGGKQLYNFHDKSDRHIALRPEMTPSLARMVADKYSELRFPLRWFSIPNCFRYEAPQKGRLREFWQLNVDIIGQKAGSVDLEMMFVVSQVMKAFGATKESFKIKFNHRELLEKYLQNNGFAEEIPKIYNLLDNYYKKNEYEFEDEILALQNPQNINGISNLLGLLGHYNFRNNGKNMYFELSDNFEEMQMLLGRGNFVGNDLIFENVDLQFEPTIVRGLAYYTGLVFECFDNNLSNPRALFGGGRYDNLMTLFDKPQTPAIGFGSGDVTIMEFLTNWNLLDGFENFENWKKANIKEKVGIMVMVEKYPPTPLKGGEMETKEITLEKAKMEDLDFLYKVSTLVMKQVSDIIDKDVVIDEQKRFAEYQQKFEPEKIQIIKYGNLSVGRLRVLYENERIYLGGLQILPEFQNKGIGAKILQNLTQESIKRNLPIELEVHKVNTKAIHFYKKFGFETFEETEKQFKMRFMNRQKADLVISNKDIGYEIVKKLDAETLTRLQNILTKID